MNTSEDRWPHLKAAWDLIFEALLAWHRDKVSRLAAALAFYALFSMAPALLMIIAVASAMIGESAARQETLAYLEGLMGPGRAAFVLSVGERANRELSGTLGTLIGAGVLLFGATVLFAELRGALNDIWNVTHPPGKRKAVKRYLTSRLLTFLMVLSLGGLLSAAVSANAALHAAGELLGQYFEVPGLLLQVGAVLIVFTLMTLLFAVIFKILPETEIRWGDVWSPTSTNSPSASTAASPEVEASSFTAWFNRPSPCHRHPTNRWSEAPRHALRTTTTCRGYFPIPESSKYQSNGDGYLLDSGDHKM